MSVADLIQAMSDAGAPMDAIIIAVRALEAKDVEIASKDEEAAARRAKDAERKRAERASRRVRGQSADDAVTVDGRSEELPLSPSPFSFPRTPNQNPHPHAPGKAITRAREAGPMPADWQPKALTGAAAAAADGWPPGAAERELQRFRDWAASTSGSNGRKKDWDAAWRNWVLKADDEGRYGNGRKPNRNGTDAGRESTGDIALRLAGRSASVDGGGWSAAGAGPGVDLLSAGEASWHVEQRG